MGISLAIRVLEANWESFLPGLTIAVWCFASSWEFSWVDLLFLASPTSSWGLKSLQRSGSNESRYNGCCWLNTNSIRHCPKWLTRNMSFLSLHSVGRYYYFLQFLVGTWRVTCSRSQSHGSSTSTQNPGSRPLDHLSLCFLLPKYYPLLSINGTSPVLLVFEDLHFIYCHFSRVSGKSGDKCEGFIHHI